MVEIGYDGLVPTGSKSITNYSTMVFMKFRQYFQTPYTIRDIYISTTGGPLTVTIYPNTAENIPDTSNVLCSFQGVNPDGGYYWPPPWYGPYSMNFQMNDPGDIWIGIRKTVTSSRLTYAGQDNHNNDASCFMLSAGVFYPIEDGNLLIRAVFEGEPLPHDVAPFSIDKDRTLDVPDRYTCPSNHPVTPRTSVKNYGAVSENFSIEMVIDSCGFQIYNSDQIVSGLEPDSIAHVAFSNWWVADSGAVYNVRVCTNLIGDVFPGNDTLRVELISTPQEEFVYDWGLLNACAAISGVSELTKRMTPASYPIRLLYGGAHNTYAGDFSFTYFFYRDQAPDDFYNYTRGDLTAKVEDIITGPGWCWINVIPDSIIFNEGDFYLGYWSNQPNHRFDQLPPGFEYGQRVSQSNLTNLHIRAGGRYTPLPPTLYYPNNNETIYDSTITFTWSNTAGLKGIYCFQLASDSTFMNIFEDTIGVQSNQIQINLSDSGSYYWRVKAFDSMRYGSIFQEKANRFTLTDEITDSAYIESAGIYNFNENGNGHPIIMHIISLTGQGNIIVNQRNDLPVNFPGKNPCSFYWDVLVDNGIENVNTDIVFHYTDNDIIGYIESAAYFGIAKFNSSTNTWQWLGGAVDAENNTVTVTGVTSFSTFALYRRIFGDINGDGYVDAADLQRLGDCWHATNSGEFTAGSDARFFNYNKNTDGGNQIIDAADLQVFGDCWHNGEEP